MEFPFFDEEKYMKLIITSFLNSLFQYGSSSKQYHFMKTLQHNKAIKLFD